jgi:hypothetical protein
MRAVKKPGPSVEAGWKPPGAVPIEVIFGFPFDPMFEIPAGWRVWRNLTLFDQSIGSHLSISSWEPFDSAWAQTIFQSRYPHSRFLYGNLFEVWMGKCVILADASSIVRLYG